MINSVNSGSLNNLNTSNAFSAKKTENNLRCKKNQHCNNPSFGYREDYEPHPIRDFFLSVTSGTMGLIGFNAALLGLRSFVIDKMLIGKINKHFTSKISKQESNKLEKLANEMMDGIRPNKQKPFDYTILNDTKGEAFYTHEHNHVFISKNQKSSLFHEVGHAIQENNTKVFKRLQRGRGRYAYLSLALYALMPRKKDNNGENESIINRNLAVPLLAFSPELITEAKASKLGLDFLKKKLDAGEITKSMYKNIKHSYLTCFATYLFIPLSIIMMHMLESGAQKAVNKRKAAQYYNY